MQRHDGAEIYFTAPSFPKLSLACVFGDLENFRALLADPAVNPAQYRNQALRLAARHNNYGLVKRLLADKRVHPGDQHDQAIRKAAKYGHVETVKLLLGDERVNPATNNDYALWAAARGGHSCVLNLLLADVRIGNNFTAHVSADRSDVIDLLVLNGLQVVGHALQAWNAVTACAVS